METIVLDIINKNTDSFVQIIKSKYPDFYKEVNEKYEGITFSEKIYRWLNSTIEIGLCIKCKKPVKFLNIRDGFRKYCSSKCANFGTADVRSKKLIKIEKDLNTWEQKECKMCKSLFWTYKKRNGQFCSNKCSAKFNSNNKSIIDKIKSTKLNRYGNSNYTNLEKAKQTSLERYNEDNPSKSQEVIDRIKDTNFKKYGCDWSWQSEPIKSKIRQSCINKYGVENVSKSPIIRDKIIKTCTKHYGVGNPSRSQEVIDKIKKTNLERFGNICPIMNPDILRKVEISRRKVYYNKVKTRLSGIVELLFDENHYISTDKSNKYRFRCIKCDHEFEDHMDGGRIPRCLNCYPYLSGTSLDEKEIVNYLKAILPSEIIIKEKCWDILKNRELDIYIPEKKIAIEFNGLYWHSEIGGNKDRYYHYNKYNECLQQGIRLLQIFEDEWIYKSDIVKNRILHIISQSSERIYARKCKLVELTPKDTANFLNKYHIQGNIPSKQKVGLLYNDRLVSVMTFSIPRICMGRKNEEGNYELLRMASSCNVIGGPSKMFSYFINKYNPKHIVTYADMRWNTGNVYKKMGMIEDGITEPNYWYFKPGQPIRYHRFNFRKNVLPVKLQTFDPQLTEWENMQLNGYDRIWDCGNNKYIWKKN